MRFYMPLVKSFETPRRVRQDPDFISVAIIIMYSNSKDESDMEKAFSLGADDYEIKPCGKRGCPPALKEFLIRKINE